MAEGLTTAVTTPETTTTGETGRANLSLILLLTCWLRPATNAPRLAHLKLRWAYLIHILAGLAFFLALLALADVDTWVRLGSTRGHALAGEILREFRRDSDTATLATAFTVLGVEAGFAALALVVLPWGAGDERLRSSWAHALRLTWLHTTHALFVLLLVSPIAIGLRKAKHSYSRAHAYPSLSYPSPPTFPTNAAPGSQLRKDYQQAYQKYLDEIQRINQSWQQVRVNYRRSEPFTVRHSDDLIVWLCTAGLLWVLWALFRAAGARRELAAAERPPTCEVCGYNLTGTAVERRCPECGTPAIESLGLHVRTGTDWERGGSWRAWWRCSIAAVFRPGKLGRQIQVSPQPRRHRWCLAFPFVPLFLANAVSLVACYVIDMKRNPLVSEPEVATVMAPLVGILHAIGLPAIALVVAAWVGMIQTWQNGRNLLPAAAQVASYLNLYLLSWGCFAALWLVGLFIGLEEKWFQELKHLTLIDEEVLAFGFMALPHIAWLSGLIILIWKGTAAARYANK